MSTSEATIEIGHDIQELKRQAGWQHVADGLKERIANATEERADLVEQIGSGDVSDMTLHSAKIARLTGTIEGLQMVEEITETLLRKMEAAQKEQ